MPALSNIDIYRGKEPTKPTNLRLLWQAELGRLFPDIWPQLVYPERATSGLPLFDFRRYYPVEKIHGIEWQKLLSAPDVPLTTHLDIARTTAQQIQQIFSATGIIIADRHANNVMLELAQPFNPLARFSQSYRVKQVDTAADYIYDTVTDQTNVPPPNLEERQRQHPDAFSLTDAADPTYCAECWRISLLIILDQLMIAVEDHGIRMGYTSYNLNAQKKSFIRQYWQLANPDNLEEITQAFFTVCDEIAKKYV
jgi:hypothetical protein